MPPAADIPVVSYRGVSFAYPAAAGGRGQTALQDVTLDVPAAHRLGILGPNGGGKSTLLKLTLGFLEPTAGSIEVFGLPPAHARRSGIIGYVPQRSDAELAFPITGRQAVEMAASVGLTAWSHLSSPQRDACSRAIDLVGAGAFADRPVGKMSGGQFQRILIARALARSPRLLLLDEPTIGIDPAGQQQFADMLTRLTKELGLTIIVVSHDLRTVAAGCDRVACLSRTLHFHDAPRGLTPAVLAEVFRHDVAAIFGDIHVDAHTASECSHGHHHH